MPAVIEELETVDSQRLVAITSIEGRRRYHVVDPRRNPPNYWT
jgi:hypothetical protein